MPETGISPSRNDMATLSGIVAALGETGFCLPGSVAQRSYRCGKQACACHAEPPRLHGPYIQWTRRIGAKTVHTNLSPEQYEDYRELFDNAARLRRLVADLEELSLAVIATDPRLKDSVPPTPPPGGSGI